MVLEDLWDHTEIRDRWVMLDWKVHLELKDELDLRVQQENQLKRVKLVFLDFLVLLVEMGFQDHVDCLESPDPKENLEKMV